MVWLTQDEIKRESEKSPEAALDVSIKHYDQMLGATEEEFNAAYMADGDGVGIGASFCGLCQRYKGSLVPCPLKGGFICNGRCTMEWANFRSAIWTWLRSEEGKKRRAYWEEARRTMCVVREKLLEARDKKGDHNG